MGLSCKELSTITCFVLDIMALIVVLFGFRPVAGSCRETDFTNTKTQKCLVEMCKKKQPPTEIQKLINSLIVISAVFHRVELFYRLWAAKVELMSSVNKCTLHMIIMSFKLQFCLHLHLKSLTYG